ncbi:MAG: PDZ domain-containing protein, partial [Myxococcota bacterium]
MSSLIAYTLQLPNPNNHLVEIAITFPIRGDGTALEVSLPSWSPGSYLMREYARRVQEFQAFDAQDRPLTARKIAKGTWSIPVTEGQQQVRVQYRVYAHELSVRHCHVDTSHAFLHGPALFMYAEGRKEEPCRLTVQAPHDDWTLFTTLPRAAEDEGQPHRGVFQADDYDHLVDCPIEMGPHTAHHFEALGVPHTIVCWGSNRAPIARMLEEFPAFIAASAAMFGGTLPYDRYLFIVLHADTGYGGLEHRDSTALLYPGDGYVTEDHGYENMLTLASHEHFHVWNVKRIRPAQLGPFNYTEETYTRALWVIEGFTSYYQNIVVRRAGLITPERFLELLGERYGKLMQIPGRHVHPLEEASFDAWIKLYRPDESSSNTTVSYYLKGELVAALLDVTIRARTNGVRSLDDLMRLLWAHFEEDGSGYPEEQLQQYTEQIAGSDLSDFFEGMVRGTAPLDMNGALEPLGLKVIPKDHTPNIPWLGFKQGTEGDLIKVEAVFTDSPAERAGINPGDTLVALGGQRATRTTFTSLMKARTPGDTERVHLFRRGQLLDVTLT